MYAYRIRLRLSTRQHQQIYSSFQHLLGHMRDAILNIDNLQIVRELSSIIKVHFPQNHIILVFFSPFGVFMKWHLLHWLTTKLPLQADELNSPSARRSSNLKEALVLCYEDSVELWVFHVLIPLGKVVRHVFLKEFTKPKKKQEKQNEP